MGDGGGREEQDIHQHPFPPSLPILVCQAPMIVSGPPPTSLAPQINYCGRTPSQHIIHGGILLPTLHSHVSSEPAKINKKSHWQCHLWL